MLQQIKALQDTSLVAINAGLAAMLQAIVPDAGMLFLCWSDFGPRCFMHL